MSVPHKFFQSSFSSEFETHNAILDSTPYQPEVMIIGTFNPDTPNANFADFFYGRNYFWPAFKNLFVHNKVQLTKTRMPRRGAPPSTLDPTLQEILQLCEKLKLTFSDLILEVLHSENPNYSMLSNDNVVLNNVEYNLIQDSKNKSAQGLQQLDKIGQVHWNTQNIIEYLSANPQLKTIYFTRQPTGIWADQWNKIVRSGNTFATNLYTPSGQSLRGTPRMNALLKHWVHNKASNFGYLDNQWLQKHGVNPNNF